MKKTLLPLVLFATGSLVLVSTPAAHADNIVVGDTYTMTVNPYASGENDGSYYVGLTTIHITGNGVDDTFSAYCIDALHDITVPATYQVKAQGVGSDYSPYQAGNQDILQDQAALGFNFGTGLQNDIDAQHEIWNLSGAMPSFGTNANQTALAATAEAYTGSYDGIHAFEEIGGDGQSFMTTSPVPEPSSLALLGTGLAGFAGFLKRKMQA